MIQSLEDKSKRELIEIYKADDLLLRIIGNAFELPVQEVEGEKLIAKWEFCNVWFERCLSKEFKINEVIK